MVAGWLLARAGVDVIVLEKHRDFLRDFRGDTIHPSTLETMYELGALDELLMLPHTRQQQLSIDLMCVRGADGRHSVIREGLPRRELSVPSDVLWMRLPRRPSDGEALFGTLRADQFLVMIDRGDYWQCAYLIRKGGLDELKAAGLPAFRTRLSELAPMLADRVDALT